MPKKPAPAPPPATAAAPRISETLLELQIAALTLHVALSKAIAPANATSLRATPPMDRWADFSRLPTIVVFAIGISLAGAVGFVTTTEPIKFQQPKERATDPPGAGEAAGARGTPKLSDLKKDAPLKKQEAPAGNPDPVPKEEAPAPASLPASLPANPPATPAPPLDQ